MFAVFNTFFAVYFLRRDPALIERRLKQKEQRGEQKLFQIFWLPLWTVALLTPGFDYRFGWSNVPVWLSVTAQVVVAISWVLILMVFRFNSFAATVIQVEEGQKVISDGPYRIVRHPMYSGIVLMCLANGFALGSYVAVAPSLLLIPVIVYRLLHEERALAKELPGYTDYCARTPWRLVPGIY
jgi:protein-S-isoprenylcysteine O-methyltransferase Ste14